METLPRCGYLSRVVDLPVAIAELLFDDATQSLGSAVPSAPAPLRTALLPPRPLEVVTGAIDDRLPGAASDRRAA